MRPWRRKLLRQLVGTAALASQVVVCGGAAAQIADAFPSRAIRLVVPVPPGGPADNLARGLAERLRHELGQAVVVDNRPGASGMLGTGLVQQAVADGYTLLVSLPSAQITAPLLIDKPAFDGATDFTPIGRFARFNAVLLVNDSAPTKDFAAFTDYARKRPGQLNYASTGTGSNPHLVMELVKLQRHLHLVHIPYKGGAPAVQALLAGEVQAMFADTATTLPWIRSGRLRPLAVVSDKRLPLLPDVPTLAEVGVADAPAGAWMGLAGPRGLPEAVVQRLSKALDSALRQPDLRRMMAAGGGEAAWSSPEELQALWRADRRRWGDLVRTNHIKAD